MSGWKVESIDGVVVTNGTTYAPSASIAYADLNGKGWALQAQWVPTATIYYYQTPSGWKYETIGSLAADAVGGYASLMGLTMSGTAGAYTLNTGSITMLGANFSGLDVNLTLAKDTSFYLGGNKLVIPNDKSLTVSSGSSVIGTGVVGSDIYTNAATSDARYTLLQGSCVELSDGGTLTAAGKFSNCFISNCALTNQASKGLNIAGDTVSMSHPVELRAENENSLPSTYFTSAPGINQHICIGLILKVGVQYEAIQTLGGLQLDYTGANGDHNIKSTNEFTHIPDLTGWIVATAGTNLTNESLFGRLNLTNTYLTLGKNGTNKLGAINNIGIDSVIVPNDDSTAPNYEPTYARSYLTIADSISDCSSGSTLYIVRPYDIATVGNSAFITKTESFTVDKNLTVTSALRASQGYFDTVTYVVDVGTVPNVLAGTVTVKAPYILTLGNIKVTGNVKLLHGSNGQVQVSSDKSWDSNEVVTLDASDLTVGAVVVLSSYDVSSHFTLTNTMKNQGYYLAPSGTNLVLSKYSSSSGGGASEGTSYPINVSNANNGSIQSSHKTATAYTKVTVTVTPDKGYKVSSLAIKDANGKTISFTDNGNGTFTFSMPSSAVTVTSSIIKKPVDPKDTGIDNLLECSDHMNYIHGYLDNSVQPYTSMTRAEASQMFYNLLKKKNRSASASFVDVNAKDWYANAVKVLADIGIIKGYQNGTFGPEKPISRQEFCAMAMRFATKIVPESEYTTSFTDVAKDAWSYHYIMSASSFGWINGTGNLRFDQTANITRAEVVTIVNHMLGRAADQSFVNDHTSSMMQFNDLTDKSTWFYNDVVEASNAHNYSFNSNGNESWSGLK